MWPLGIDLPPHMGISVPVNTLNFPMHVIGPKCRPGFIPADYAFVVEVLGRGKREREALYRLLADDLERDRVLDDEALFHALLEEQRLLSVSSGFYFYIMVRRVFLKSGLTDRGMADYVASVLTEFSRMDRVRRPAGDRFPVLDYLVDMAAAMAEASEELRFFMALHIGNVALFLAGVFPDYIRYREQRRAAPGLRYYESMGESHLRAAGDHRLADRYELMPVVRDLAEAFRPARRALNDLADRFLGLDEAWTI